MLQNLASYLLGGVSNSEQGATAEGVENPQRRLTAARADIIEEDDWVLVDHQDSEGNSDDASSVDSLDIEWDTQDHRTQNDALDNGCPLPTQLTRRSSLPSRRSSQSSLPSGVTATMDESWFLTPPPCFTSTGPVHMETSPMENLLIEHPSMSVYHQHSYSSYPLLGLSSPLRTNEYGDDLRPLRRDHHEEDEFSEEDVEDEQGNQIAIVHRVVGHSRTPAQAIQDRARQFEKNKQAQKVQIQKASEPLKRSFLKRTNKAREVNCRNQRQRRGQRSQGAQRSHANNNRKC